MINLMNMNNIHKRNQLIQIAQQASATILKHKQQGLRVYSKKDGSVVTSADHASEHVIVNALRSWCPETPVVSEEEHAAGSHVCWQDHVWLVDPLDSTSGFVRGSPDYAICIAEIVNHQPEWGVVAVPETGVIYVAHVSAQQLWKVTHTTCVQIQPDTDCTTPYKCVLSPTDVRARHLCGNSHIQFRGSALKFGLVAEGAADVYVRSGSLMHWDIAAGHALVQAAGGSCTTHTGAPIQYMPHMTHLLPFVARSRAVCSHPLTVL